ncbi:MAG: glycoside hydrolase family 65 protein [Ilumatobacteraceae bacterium]
MHRPLELLDERRFPIDPWRLIDIDPAPIDLGRTETLFATANGYLGMRDNPPEGRVAHTHGTYVNGFHETWEIQHAESAHAFARVGQTLVNVPDAKVMKLYVDDEPIRVDTADLEKHERLLDFSKGTHERSLIWRTPAGKRISMTTTRLISLEHRHLALIRLELVMLEGRAPVVISSQLLNRQDGADEYESTTNRLAPGDDPRRGRQFERRVLEPIEQRHVTEFGDGGEIGLSHRTLSSKMRIAVACRHEVSGDVSPAITTTIQPDHAKVVFAFDLEVGQRIVIDKWVSYHTAREVPCGELLDRCHRTIDRACEGGVEALFASQESTLQKFWDTADLRVDGDPRSQQAIRWNLFQLVQATAAADEHGIPAKGVTSAGYDGHYFWDTEVYVIPFLARTNPGAARKLLRFRHGLLDAARRRAAEMSQVGALYPWRTINGEEASAYYAAGTAQYHINAAVAYAIEQYTRATGDLAFLHREGAEILVETARLWHDLGFISRDGAFHIHRVTGPDEYTTVVNDNLYTNVMARFNLRFAAQVLRRIVEDDDSALQWLRERTGVNPAEADDWDRCADLMYLPFDAALGIHPQDDSFLDLEPWDFAGTPSDQYPLLLHFHPLVIYRHQVLKQADVVLAMYLRGEHFDRETKRRNFDYYDPITTGDSSLSACVQSIAASEVGYRDLAYEYFLQALHLDLSDTHGNTVDGVHIANAGGVWAGLVHGFGGIRFTETGLAIAPDLPDHWEGLSIGFVHCGSRCRLEVNRSGWNITVFDGPGVLIELDNGAQRVDVGCTYSAT